jgi:glycerol-3-phosphate dehydrogenase (NAD(P)+)
MPLTAVIGTGAWGTAIAALACRSSSQVLLLGRSADKIAALDASRRHPDLPASPLPVALRLSAEPRDLAAADLVLWAVPTQHSREQARRLRGFLPAGAGVISLSKGLEQQTLKRVTELLGEELGERPYGALSGPSLAAEVMAGLPFGLVVAGPEALCQLAVERLHTPRCRLYTSSDLLGVELGGALKNVIAIAAGICDGLGLGDNAKAAIMTRGLAEMRRLGRAMGANDATFAGLAGIGDLLTSCYSPLGRNRSLGLAIARGESAQDILARSHTVAEGAWTCRAAVELGTRCGVELPIASQVAFAIWAATPVTQAMEKLLSRAPKEEDA